MKARATRSALREKTKTHSADFQIPSTAPAMNLESFIDAFTNASGLPLVACGKSGTGAHCCGEEMPGFCQLIHGSGSPQIKRMCDMFNRRLEESAASQAHGDCCFAGIQITAVPVANGTEKVGYLKTGHVMPNASTSEAFQSVMNRLSEAGLDYLGNKLREEWFAIPMMEPKKYEAFIQLLSAFSHQLAEGGEMQDHSCYGSEAPALLNAQKYIERNCGRPIRLNDVAQAIGWSPGYLCRKFHDHTGVTFTLYLSRIRVAHAARMLHNPNKRIKEIAYETGFNSISQFNRVFHNAMGQSPSLYRRGIHSNHLGSEALTSQPA